MRLLLTVAGVGCLAGAVIAQVPGVEPVMPLPPVAGPVNWPSVVLYAMGLGFLWWRQRGTERRLRGRIRRLRTELEQARTHQDRAEAEQDRLRRQLEEVEARGEAQGRLLDGVVMPMVGEAVKRQSESGLLPAVPPEPAP